MKASIRTVAWSMALTLVLGSLALSKTAAIEQPNDGAPQATAVQPTEPLEAGDDNAAPLKARDAASVELSGLPDDTADANTMVAHFIDVGQGDATLLEFKCGLVLIDTGGEKSKQVSGRTRLVRYLNEFFKKRPQFARTLDLVVLSHPHIDHTDGVDGLLAMQPAVNILNVLDNGMSTGRNSGIAGQKHLQAYAKQTGAGYVGLAQADIKTVSGVTNKVINPIKCRQGNTGVKPKIVALWGRVDDNVDWANDANNDSVVLRIDFGKASFLFTGDLASPGIAAMMDAYSPGPKILDVDVLKVDHHGSNNATTKAFLKATSPKIAVAQSGDSTLSHDDNTAWVYGHPNLKAVNLLVDPTIGVSESRDPRTFPVGVSGRPLNSTQDPVFTTLRIDRALYDNGWDGNIAITAKSDGTLSVQTEF